MTKTFLIKEEIENEILRLQHLLPNLENSPRGLCRHCGSLIDIHPISEYIETMLDGELLTIPISIIPTEIIEAAMHNANIIRKKNGLNTIHGRFLIEAMGKINHNFYTIGNPVPVEGEDCYNYIKFTELNEFGEIETRND